jgi:hypothetical protein
VVSVVSAVVVPSVMSATMIGMTRRMRWRDM